MRLLDWVDDCGDECARCGAPLGHWVHRSLANPLNWISVRAPGTRRSEVGMMPSRPKADPPAGWRLHLVQFDDSGTWCRPCAMREDRLLGLRNYPHSKAVPRD